MVGKEIMIEGAMTGYVRSRTKGSTYVIEIEGARQTMELGPKSGQKNFTIVGQAPPPTEAGRKRKATDVLNVNTKAGSSYASAPAGSTAAKGRPTKKGKARGGKGRGGGQEQLRGDDNSEPLASPPAVPRPPIDIETLLAEIVGMESLKERLREFSRKIKIDAAKREAGHSPLTSTYHMWITGNPGTGKTTVARILHGMLQSAGVLAAEAPFIEFKPSDAEGSVLGEAREKTRVYIGNAKGGVLFADEAHNITNDKQNMYGTQVAQELMNCLHSGDVIVIYAGEWPWIRIPFSTANRKLQSAPPRRFPIDRLP